MLKRQNALSGALIVIFALAMVVPVHGQVNMTDDEYQAPNKVIEPGDATPMLAQRSPAALGSGITVMKFTIKDTEPQADNPSDVKIRNFQILNLGTADHNDIAEVMCLDKDGNAVAPLAKPQKHSNPNIAFKATCDVGSYTLPDGETQEFAIAVRTVGTNQLADDDQNNSLKLQVKAEYRESVGSPASPSSTTFHAEATDGARELIYNGGVNSAQANNGGVESLMPGDQGVVSRFTVCDKDANEHNLVIDELLIKQGDEGTALFSDFSSLELYRIDNSGRSPLGTLTPGVGLNRGGTSNSLPFPTNMFVQDDSCSTFEIEAQVSPYAYKGKVIQFEYQLSAEEPSEFPVDRSVDPQVVMKQPTAIGKGVVQVADGVILPGQDGGDNVTADVPLNVRGFPLPGFGSLQVGANGKLSYDPSVVRVKTINGVTLNADGTVSECTNSDQSQCDYAVHVTNIDNRKGTARFTVSATQTLLNRLNDPTADPEQLPLQNGPVAFIQIEGVGSSGDSARLNLTFTEVQGANNKRITDAVGTDSGVIDVVAPGDLNRDGKVTVSDSLALGQALINDCAGLSDIQKRIADVATPQANVGTVPSCTGSSPDLDSADVAEISSLALDSGASSAGVEASDAELTVQPLSVNRIQSTMTGGTLGIHAIGQGITGMQVDVFNLSGDHVISERATTDQLRVRMSSNTGQPLANGVYLYTVTIEGSNGQVERSDVRKIVVLR